MPRTKAELQHNIRRQRRSQSLDLLLRAYSVMGVLMAILSLGYFCVSYLKIELTSNQQMALVSAGVGIALALMSRALILLRKEKESVEMERLKEYESLSGFLSAWALFERKSKDYLAKDGEPEGFNRHSLRAIISRLHDAGKITESDVLALEEALHVRNSVVHGDRSFPLQVAEKITATLVDIIRKIV